MSNDAHTLNIHPLAITTDRRHRLEPPNPAGATAGHELAAADRGLAT